MPSEHVFSDAGLTDDKRRRRLAETTFSAIQTVKNRYKRERRNRDAAEIAARAAQQARWLADDIAQVQLNSIAPSPV